MATVVSKQTLVDGERNLVVKIHFVGDADGDVTDQNLIDVSSYLNAPTEVRIDRAQGFFRGFSLDIHWDATTNVDIQTLPGDTDFDFDYKPHGGLINNGGSGVTGDILYSEIGMGAGDEGAVTLWMVKK